MSHSKSDDFLEECRSRKRNVVFPGAGLRAADLSNEAPTPDVVSQALELAREAAARITAQFGTALDRAARLKVARAFERVVVPREKRRPGRKRKAAITAAVTDYEAGMRGVELYRKHIPGYSGMSHYRRLAKQRTLAEAIHSRRRRERVQERGHTEPVPSKP